MSQALLFHVLIFNAQCLIFNSWNLLPRVLHLTHYLPRISNLDPLSKCFFTKSVFKNIGFPTPQPASPPTPTPNMSNQLIVSNNINYSSNQQCHAQGHLWKPRSSIRGISCSRSICKLGNQLTI